MIVKPSGIRLEGIGKRFRGGVDAVRDLDLAVTPGEFIVLVGPSGCGKSTVLRMIAGLEEITTGRIFLGDTDVTQELPQRRVEVRQRLVEQEGFRIAHDRPTHGNALALAAR